SLNVSCPSATFMNPATSLAIAGGGGSTLVQLKTMDSAFAPALETFSSPSSADSFQFINANAIASTTTVGLNTAIMDLNGVSPTMDALNGDGLITNSNAAAATLTMGASGGSGLFLGTI